LTHPHSPLLYGLRWVSLARCSVLRRRLGERMSGSPCPERRCYGSVSLCRMKPVPMNAALLPLAVSVACGALLLTPGCNGSVAPGTPKGADGGSSSLNPDASVSPADATASTGIDSAPSTADATASTVIDSPSAGIDSASPGDGTASPGNDSAPPGIDSASPDDVGAPDIDGALPSDAGAPAAVDSGADSGAIAPTIQGCPATQPIDLSTANGSISVPACETGFAHPNICCRASPTQATECADCPGAPFAACDNASLTFPDPGTCCSLADGGCGEASVLSAPPMDSGLELNCSYPCGPGGYSPHELQSLRQPVCSDLADGSLGICLYCCFGSGECPTNTCLGGPTTPPTRCGSDNCGLCPVGWQAPARGQYDLCCQTDTAGVARCFSQSGSISSL